MLNLQRVIALKLGGNECPWPPSELQRFAPLWAQLQVQGSGLVRLSPVNSDAAKQIQVFIPRSLVP